MMMGAKPPPTAPRPLTLRVKRGKVLFTAELMTGKLRTVCVCIEYFANWRVKIAHIDT